MILLCLGVECATLYKNMRKLVNLRIPVLAAVALILGIVIGYLLYLKDISITYAFMVLPLFVTILIFCLIFKRSQLCITTIIIIPLAFLLGIGNCILRINNFEKSTIISDRSYTITATIQDKGKTKYGEYLILENATIDGKKLDGKIIAYAAYDYIALCNSGFKVTFTTKIKKNNLITNNRLSFYALNNFKYSCSITSDLSHELGFNLFSNFRAKIRNALYSNTDKDIAPVIYAMFTGYTGDIDNSLHTNFNYSGISHIFAVSGLHVGILYGLVYFVLRILHVNKYIRTFVSLSLLLFYIGLCGFTPSSVRAGIMCCVLAFARLSQQKYDGLNALALAAIFITTINPFNLFDIGFQLSMCAVMGILILKLPRKIPNSIRVPISAQVSTMPILIYGFGYASGAGLVLNIIIIPILSILFSALFASTLVSIAFPFLGFLLTLASIPLQAIVSFFTIFGFENVLIVLSPGFWIPITYLAIFIASDKINISPLKRISILTTLLIAIVCCIAFGV